MAKYQETMVGGSTSRERASARYVVRGTAAAGALAILAACTSHGGSAPESPIQQPTAAVSQPSAPATSEAPSRPNNHEAPPTGLKPNNHEVPPKVIPSPDNCNSIRAARPGVYFNEGYKSHMQDQLHTMWVALSPNANTDLNSDYIPWLQMSHAMEDDPEYSDAMYRAYTIMAASKAKTGLPQQVSAEQVLGWQIAAPQMCGPGAPQRLTDEASRKNLQETKTVSGAVFHGLTDHLADQTSRLLQPLAMTMKNAWQSLEADIEQQLQQLQQHS